MCRFRVWHALRYFPIDRNGRFMIHWRCAAPIVEVGQTNGGQNVKENTGIRTRFFLDSMRD